MNMINEFGVRLGKKWKLGQGPVPHLIKLLENKGVKIFEVPEAENFDGLSGFEAGINIPVIAVYKGT